MEGWMEGSTQFAALCPNLFFLEFFEFSMNVKLVASDNESERVSAHLTQNTQAHNQSLAPTTKRLSS